MNLVFEESVDDGFFALTNFTCANGRKLLKDSSLYKIIWAKDDIGNIMIDGCDYKFEKDQLIFCTPLNLIEIPLEHNALVSVVFNREFYCIRDNDEEVSCNGLLFYGSSSPAIIMLEDADKQVFEDLYAIIKEELIKKNRSYGEMLKVMLKRLIIKSTRMVETLSSKKGETSEQKEIIRAFHILVEKNYKTHHKLTDYATLLHKSPKTLSNIFSEYSNTTPLHVINDRLIVEARRLLLYSNKSIKDIAALLGYTDAGHFSKFFKINIGVSPKSFKKESLENFRGNNLHI